MSHFPIYRSILCQRCVTDIQQTDSGAIGRCHRVSTPPITADRQLWFMNSFIGCSLFPSRSALGSGLNLSTLSVCVCVWVVVIINKDRAWVLKGLRLFPKSSKTQGSLSNHRSHGRRLIAGCCEKTVQSLWHRGDTMVFPSSLCHSRLAVWLLFDCKTPGFSAKYNHVFQLRGPTLLQEGSGFFLGGGGTWT